MPNPLLVGLLIADPALRQELRALVEALDAQVAFEAAQLDWEPLARLHMALVLADARPGGEPLNEFVRQMKSLARGTLVGVVQTAAQPELLMAALQAGADEFILPPLDTGLKAALERAAAAIAQREESQPARARTVGFVSAKGGSGATTLACHAAAALDRLSGQRVLLVDGDLDLPLVGFLMKCAGSYSLLDAANNLQHLEHGNWTSLVARAGRLDVLPCPTRRNSGEFVRPEALRQVFGFLRSLYAWVVVDLGRGLNPLTRPVLGDFDDLFVVTTVSVPAISQARNLLQRVVESGFPPVRLRLVLNRVTHPVPLGADVMRPLLGAPVAAEIGEDKALDEAYAEGKLAAASTALGRDVQRFAARVGGLPAPKISRWPWLDTWRKPVTV